MKNRRKRKSLRIGRLLLVIFITVGLLVGAVWGLQHMLSTVISLNSAPPAAETQDPSVEKVKINGVTIIRKKNSAAIPESTPASPVAIATPKPAQPPANSYLGHLPYAEISQNQLVSVGDFARENYVRTEYLAADAAASFLKMQSDAKQQGIQLMPISGFRSAAAQRKLFERQVERKGSQQAAAQYSAPPGHSEHHTGYAIDITEAQNPAVDLKYAFEQTQTYRWLENQASAYDFELSFPRNNQQNVNFEPWHWRYIGTPAAAQVFAIAEPNR